MPTPVLPEGASPARRPTSVRLQIVTPSPAPPEGEGGLHETKHDGHRLVAIIDDHGRLSLISRNGFDRTEALGAPFAPLAAAGHELIIDGEIAVPDNRGITHLDFLNDTIARCEPHRLVYYAFDLLHSDSHDIRRCRIEKRKEVLRRVLDEARCERIIYVDYMVGYGRQLFEAVRQVGAEGVVSKRRGSLYREAGRATGLRPNEDAYVKLWETIKERGVPARWVGRTYRYWYCGDGWRYWCMGPKWPY